MRFAIITPSYRRDYSRCHLLAQSIDLFMRGDFEHIIVVDSTDLPLFNRLQGPRRRVICREKIIPDSCFLQSKRPNGWIRQQLVKLTATDFLDHELFLFIDSDVVLVNFLSIESLVDEASVTLFRQPITNFDTVEANLLHSCSRILRLKSAPHDVKYIWQLIVWRRDVLQELKSHIQEIWGTTNWLSVLSRESALSEYNLYGMFVDLILKDIRRHHRDDSRIRCHCRWTKPFTSDQEIAEFLGRLPIGCPSVMISSRIGAPVRRYKHHIDQIWKSALTAAGLGRAASVV